MVSRRDFIQQSSILAAGAMLAARHTAAASERIRLGIIGTANRGGQLMDALAPHGDAEMVAFCDVHGVALERWRKEFPNADFYGDYRRIIERDDIDGVLIATPDHWHAIQTVEACQAGKDVYIEKPLALKIAEGRRIVDVAKETKRVVQSGLHRRSSPFYKELATEIQAGLIGKVTSAICYRVSNMTPDGIGHGTICDPPEDLDWDMWIGPQQMRPYQDNITPYKFRWWKDYSSQLANWAVHYFDMIRWILGEGAPISVVAIGGKYAVDDDRTIPDTMQAVFELSQGALLTFSHLEASNNQLLSRPAEIELRGTLGTLYVRGGSYEIIPERGGQFMDPALRMEPIKKAVDKEDFVDLTTAHMRNFLDCIKSRNRPNCDAEEAHISTIYAHLANISLDTRLRLDWDQNTERITNSTEANEGLQYTYREPWKLS
ncbi:MAG: Gfo/Idh/MocA family oxidoreductase [Candidatus Hydrogenedentes bacterium]|jgi:predicted dehydrogenase|nr:Gfo/Idh/MocA family oxidoreductase [Candidatus Hydrogenedentota bacterium]